MKYNKNNIYYSKEDMLLILFLPDPQGWAWSIMAASVTPPFTLVAMLKISCHNTHIFLVTNIFSLEIVSITILSTLIFSSQLHSSLFCYTLNLLHNIFFLILYRSFLSQFLSWPNIFNHHVFLSRHNIFVKKILSLFAKSHFLSQLFLVKMFM